MAAKEEFDFAPVTKLGSYTTNDTYLQKHIDLILKLPLVDVDAIKSKGFKVVVDAVNSQVELRFPFC